MFVDKINGYTGVDHAVVKPVTTYSKKKKQPLSIMSNTLCIFDY